MRYRVKRDERVRLGLHESRKLYYMKGGDADNQEISYAKGFSQLAER